MSDATGTHWNNDGVRIGGVNAEDGHRIKMSFFRTSDYGVCIEIETCERSVIVNADQALEVARVLTLLANRLKLATPKCSGCGQVVEKPELLTWNFPKGLEP